MILPLITAIPRAVLCGAQNLNSRKDVVINYPSIEEAIKDILICEPQVIAFGEIHPDPGFAYKSTKARFTENVLYLLASSGIRDLIVEQILNDPKIEAELKYFYDSGCEIDKKNTPTLVDNIKYSDKQDLINMLKRCRELRIRVHSGGMTINQAKMTIKRADFVENNELKKKARILTGKATKSKITYLLSSAPGSRFAIYGGIIHNNRAPINNQKSDGTYFGYYLSGILREKYFEVDLVAPQEGAIVGKLIDITNWRAHVPKKGATIVKRGNTQTIFFPSGN